MRSSHLGEQHDFLAPSAHARPSNAEKMGKFRDHLLRYATTGDGAAALSHARGKWVSPHDLSGMLPVQSLAARRQQCDDKMVVTTTFEVIRIICYMGYIRNTS